MRLRMVRTEMRWTSMRTNLARERSTSPGPARDAGEADRAVSPTASRVVQT